MSNIVVSSIGKIKNLEFNQDCGSERTYKLYYSMNEIMCHSAETFIQEDFEFITIEESVESYQQIFHNNFQHVSDIYHENDSHNILFLDTDTLIISPVYIFDGRFKDFQMFNYTDPKELQGKDLKNKYEITCPHYFNAGVRIYPNTMNEKTWDLGWSYAKDWDYDIWGTEQIIFNKMMFSQNPDYRHWLLPEYSFQAMNLQHNKIGDTEINNYLKNWNGIHLNYAKILHLHGTRGAENTVLLQYKLWQQVTGEQFKFSLIEIDKFGKISD